MKKIMLCFALLCSFISSSTMAARPSYPFNDSIATGLSRHHIIPWEELVSFGTANFTSDADRTTLITAIIGTRTVNLGSFQGDIPQLVAGLHAPQNSEAVEVWQSLLAWTQGNLVVGTNTRPDDPGSKFDTVAYTCLKAVNHDTVYTNIFDAWRAPTATVAAKKQYFLTMAAHNIADAAGLPCWTP
ncbi:hypothetical protein RBU55_01760 [Pseudomonas chlororaphis subsp. aurantiaca]|uniref:hypothetical protein n=1 Tax=Pseudomonas chlororaphis TaxID=587753 RepID=UPI001CF3D31F|nr:hypothetical protein [Pseudomonas chlororaphis]UCR87222.1 hypothetical protein K9V45_14345 [Pseudomonas chlororaphis]WMJ00306.1 hypothetical protein RBU55_01760 [Pseudomonas chlororaphis subsp. aurantiaca]